MENMKQKSFDENELSTFDLQNFATLQSLFNRKVAIKWTPRLSFLSSILGC